jgi:hypothetical protein
VSDFRLRPIDHEEDPERCRGQNRDGPCRFKAVEGYEWCSHHIKFVKDKVKKKKARNYNLTVYQARLDELAEAPQIMSLREEIAILRMMLERRLNACKTEIDLIGSANAVGDLISKIEKVLSSCHRIEASMGLLLDKPTALAMGNRIIEVIASYIEDSDLLDRIAGDIINVIVEQKPLPKVQ